MVIDHRWLTEKFWGPRWRDRQFWGTMSTSSLRNASQRQSANFSTWTFYLFSPAESSSKPINSFWSQLYVQIRHEHVCNSRLSPTACGKPPEHLQNQFLWSQKPRLAWMDRLSETQAPILVVSCTCIQCCAVSCCIQWSTFPFGKAFSYRKRIALGTI